MKRGFSSSAPDSIELYLKEIDRHPLLTPEEEQRLARAYRQHGEPSAAHALVTANLRFVVKVAYAYRSRGLKMTDLIQEGNIGLMKAVQRFDPDKGLRLISYAVWWIRAYIQNYILRSYSLVRLGTTQAQRRLFFSLARTKRELERERGPSARGEDFSRIAERLSVKPGEVEEMALRMGARDLSLDLPLDDDGESTYLDLLASEGPSQDHELATAQSNALIHSRIGEALARLSPRERYIIEGRLMNDEPMALADLGQHFGISRERARQVEARAKEKLRRELLQIATASEWQAKELPVRADEAAAA